ncbi:MAG: tRNA pseudouridine(55) synthase TruB [bacterium]|nr:tRNA pseudouridine(55) synthase TruB [bacterium]
MKHGFLLIDKPEGPTSHDVVSMVRSSLNEKKVGHLGTLDPAASGLMVLAVGAKALKVVELFSQLPKTYDATVQFGAISSTFDREGIIEEIQRKPGVEPPDLIGLRTMIENRFLGVIDQVPPIHSAIKIGGERSYRKARQGRGVNMPTRSVEIQECFIVSYEYPKAVLHVGCGSGTYIRSLAHDLGDAIRCGGYLSGLCRTTVGDWTLESAVAPKKATWGHVIPLKDILVGMNKIDVSDSEADDIAHGRAIKHQVQPDTIAWHNDLPIAILAPLKDGTNCCKGRKVF